MEPNTSRIVASLKVQELESGTVYDYPIQDEEGGYPQGWGWLTGAGEANAPGDVMPRPYPSGEGGIFVSAEPAKPLNLTAGAGTIPCSLFFALRLLDITQIELKTTVPDTNIRWFFGN